MSSPAKKIAESIRRSMQQGFFEEHEYLVHREDRVARLDRTFYREHQQALAGQGFRHLGDLEDVSLRRVQGVRALIRLMVDRSGTISASFYRARPPLLQRVFMKLFMGLWILDTVDVESSYSDGTWLVTCTAPESKLRSPPRIDLECLPRETPTVQVLERHRLRQEAYARAHPEARAVERHSLEEQLEGQRELDRIKADFARSRGHSIDFNEFMALGGDKLNEALRQEVWKELREAASGSRPQAPGSRGDGS